MRKPGDQPEDCQKPRGGPDRFRIHQHLAGDVSAEIRFGCRTGDDQAGGGGHEQRGDLRHQALADRQNGIVLGGLHDAEALLEHPNGEPADDVDHDDDHGGNRVAPDEFARAVHRAVKIRLISDFLSPSSRFALIDKPRVQIRVDAHLLAGHGIQRKARRDFGDAARALGNHDEIDDDQDREHHNADRIVSAHDEIAERFNDVPRGCLSFVAVQEDQPSGRDIQGEPQQRPH